MSNYQVLSGTQLEDFETFGDWTASGSGGGSVESDTTYFQTGTKSLKITAQASGNEYATKTISKDLSMAGVMSVDVYVPDPSVVSSIILYLSSDSGFAKYFSRSISNFTLGWNRIVIYKNWWSNSGTDDWANTMIRLRVRVDATAGGNATVYFDNLKYGRYNRPKVILVSDDGWASQYTEAYTYMKKYGLRGTCGLVGTYIDTGNYMTLAQVTEMYNAGWDMSNHTYHHTNLTTLSTQAEMETEIIDNENWLIAQGFTRNNCHKMFVYPNGGYNQTAIDALSSRGVLAARTIVSQAGLSVGIPPLQPLLLITRNLGNTTTLASAKSDLDNAIASGSTLIYEAHKFIPSPTATTEFLDTDFEALIDYIYSKVQGNQVDMVTFSEWFKGLTQNRKSI